ncbi:MAG: SelB C-terminal domain-containing protein [Akkermansiaceae bacterium]|nr:SelB C-terminal domain-containing protein [Armatimonadota bacterium]
MESNVVESTYAVLAQQHREHTASDIAEQTGVSEAEALAAVQTLAGDGKAFAVSADGFLSDAAWKRVCDTTLRILTTYHKRNPYKRRAPDSELRIALAKAATVRDYLALKAALEDAGVWMRERGGARLPDFAVVLPPRWEAAALEMLPVFVAGGLNDPPWPGNFRANYPRDVPVDAVLDILCEQGRLVRLDNDLYIAVESLEHAKATITALADAGTPITVGAVRDATGSSRRVVVPLLETLDKQGFTARHEETRTIVSKTGTKAEPTDRQTRHR